MNPWNEFLVEDARSLSALLESKQVLDVTITSPPYWDMKDYGVVNQIGYRQSLDQYLTSLVDVFSQVWRCTSKNGSLWIIMKSVKKDGVLYLLPTKLAEKLTSQPKYTWHLQDVLIWHKPHTLPWSHRQKLQDNYECILCLSKTRKFALNIEALRSPSAVANWWVKYPERYHPFGKSLSNVWEIAIPTQGSWGNGDMEHSCPLPSELVKRIILLCTGPTGTVCDPFAGTGTTALVADELRRRWIALDINPKYRNMFLRRLATQRSATVPPALNGHLSLSNTNLKLRQLKFALLLYKRMAPSLRLTSEALPFITIAGGVLQRRPAPNWVIGCKITLILAERPSASRLREIHSAIATHCGTAPLSKFQIDASIQIVSLAELIPSGLFPPKARLHLYTTGTFWKAARTLDLHSLITLKNRGKLPILVSNLKVTEQPAY